MGGRIEVTQLLRYVCNDEVYVKQDHVYRPEWIADSLHEV